MPDERNELKDFDGLAGCQELFYERLDMERNKDVGLLY